MTVDNSPLRFSDALTENKRARDAYMRLSPAEKCRVLARASHIHSDETMRLYALSLSNEVRADEYF